MRGAVGWVGGGVGALGVIDGGREMPHRAVLERLNGWQPVVVAWVMES